MCVFENRIFFGRILGLFRPSDVDSSFAEFLQFCFMFTLVDDNARTAHVMSCVGPLVQPVRPIRPATVPNHFQGAFQPFYCLLAVAAVFISRSNLSCDACARCSAELCDAIF